MSLDIKSTILTVAYAIGINLILVSFANWGIGFSCENVQYQQQQLTDSNYTDINDPSSVEFRASVWDIIFNRCEDLPTVVWLIFEVPILIGVAYIIRGFIGAT